MMVTRIALITYAELDAAWKVFTPILHKIEGEKIKSEMYPFGTRGPASLDKFVQAAGYKRDLGYVYKQKL